MGPTRYKLPKAGSWFALYQRRRANGDTTAGAYRVVKRHLIDVVYRAMKTDAALHPPDQP